MQPVGVAVSVVAADSVPGLRVLVPPTPMTAVERLTSSLSSVFATCLEPVATDVGCRRQPFLERLYRKLDALAYGRGGKEKPVKQNGCVALQGVTISLVSLPSECHAASDAVLWLCFDGQPAQLLEQVVRDKIGVQGGTVVAEVWTVGAAGKVCLVRGHCALDHRSLLRSVQWVASKAPTLVRAAFARMQSGAHTREDEAAVERTAPARSAVSLIGRLFWTALRQPVMRDQWYLVFYPPKDLQTDEWSRPLFRIEPPARAFWADPFVLQAQDRTWLFVEEMGLRSHKAHITALSLDSQGQVADRPQTIISERWHLSYPFLWRSDDRLFMIPESSENETVDLYECVCFPYEWRKSATLLEGQRLADATVIEFEDRLWMFAAGAASGASLYDELHLFHADALTGPWHAHPLNPVKIDARSARPAGAMWIHEGRIFRPVQDCSSKYGGAIRVQCVERLSDSEFREVDSHSFRPPGIPSQAPFHTINQNQGVAVIDVLRQVICISS